MDMVVNMQDFNEKYIKYLEDCKLGDKDFTTIKPKHIFNQILKLIASKEFSKVKEIFNHPKYKEHIDIHRGNDLILAEASKIGDIDFIKYLLLEKEADIYSQKGAIFGNLIVWKQKEVLDYLIFDYKIEETPEITAMVEMFFAKDVKKLFVKRKLDLELSKKDAFERKVKI